MMGGGESNYKYEKGEDKNSVPLKSIQIHKQTISYSFVKALHYYTNEI